MGLPDSPTSNPPRWGRALRRFESTSIGPIWIGLSIAIAYLIFHGAYDAAVVAIWGFPPGFSPIWMSEQWWTDCVNAALIGYGPAAQAIARRGVMRDLTELRPELRIDDADFVSLCEKATATGGRLARGFVLGGTLLSVHLVFIDPTMSNAETQSATDPVFVWTLIRMMLTGWLLSRFSVYDFNVTRIYMALGRAKVKVDLLDIRSLAPLARRGQRSALAWVLLSMIISLFWLGDAASQSNGQLLLCILSIATFAFVGPLVALRQNIVTEKRVELDILRQQIRDARDRPDAGLDSQQLANTIAYFQLIERAREWPIDAANLLKFIGYLLLGLGSWLGGAVVERVLDTALRG